MVGERVVVRDDAGQGGEQRRGDDEPDGGAREGLTIRDAAELSQHVSRRQGRPVSTTPRKGRQTDHADQHLGCEECASAKMAGKA
jgi:hypothetical protein